jgi:hypothetical protein
LAYASDDVTMGAFSSVENRAEQLVSQLGFEYLSLVGQHSANTKGSSDEMIPTSASVGGAFRVLSALTPAPDSQLTHVLQIQLGKTSVHPGDSLVITEVRGTSDKFEVDGTYQVKGTYTLTSHDTATLALSVTAKDPKNGWGNWGGKQTITIKKGSGTFTLTERMGCEGYPHVSFYGDGGDFGGVYFGTGSWIER